MRTVTVDQRRRALTRAHHLAGDASGPEAVTRALVALHATDPASVYLSVLARSHTSTVADVSATLYEQRCLVRWMAMRRTLFVFPREDVPMVQAAVSTPLSASLRRRLVSQLERNGTEPPIDGAVDSWLAELETAVGAAVAGRGSATGAQLSTDVPALRTLIRPRAASDRPQRVTTSLLTVMGAAGRLVRATPTGTWTSRHHRWEPVTAWWPGGLEPVEARRAERDLAARWLGRFGPATVEDLQWWTGWNKTVTTRAVAGLPVHDVDLHGYPGIALGELGHLDQPSEAPVATLLPALDPTPMGWKQRDWFLAVDPARIFDRAGNIGPTVWWDGEVIGSWAVTPAGDVRTAIVADRGGECGRAVEEAAAHLHPRLEGAVVTPAARTPLEVSLSHQP